jgi:colanic acid/amylovoran biosynthesis glycosyltransferase
MKILKIAMVTGLFPAVSETFVVNQIVVLKEAGHKVDVFCFKKNQEIIHDGHKGIKNVKVLAWRQFMPQSYVKKLFKIIEILLKSISKGLLLVFLQALFLNGKLNTYTFFKTYFDYFFKLGGYDVVHVHFGNNAVLLLPQLKYFNKKIIVTFHGFDAHNYDADFYSGLLKLDAVKFTANSEFLKQKLVRLGFLSSKILVLPDGIDTNFFMPNKIVHKTYNILFVGRLIALKAPLLAIQIVEKLIQQGYKNICLTIIGEGDQLNICKNYIKANNLNEYISLVGSKSQKEIVDYMNHSDVFLFPGIIDSDGRCETQALVLREAQAMELPVIISNVGGMREGMINGETGFVVPEKDVDAFVERLLFFISNPNEHEVIGKAAREYVKEHFDIKDLGTQLLGLYTKE